MRRSKLETLALTVLVLAVGTPTGCSRMPWDERKPCDAGFSGSINAEAIGRAAIEEYDTNCDGRIDGAELDKCPGLKAAMSRVDPRGLGITADRIAARIKSWRRSHLGRMLLKCSIDRNGQPLAGAEVTFVPERFLGAIAQVARGETDASGTATICIATPPGDPPGLPPGFYRVVVTKPGRRFPRDTAPRPKPPWARRSPWTLTGLWTASGST